MNPIKVFVYKNLHKNQFSIKALEGEHKHRVIAHRNEVFLTDASPKVSEPGRQRVLAERQKNVHAGIVGLWSDDMFELPEGPEITYNPYENKTFVFKEDDNHDFTNSSKLYMYTDEQQTILRTNNLTL
jgi:hypothetical protein